MSTELLAATTELAKANQRAAGAERDFRNERAISHELTLRLATAERELDQVRARHRLVLDAIEDAIPERVTRRSAREAFAAIRRAVA